MTASFASLSTLPTTDVDEDAASFAGEVVAESAISVSVVLATDWARDFFCWACRGQQSQHGSPRAMKGGTNRQRRNGNVDGGLGSLRR